MSVSKRLKVNDDEPETLAKPTEAVDNGAKEEQVQPVDEANTSELNSSCEHVQSAVNEANNDNQPKRRRRQRRKNIFTRIREQVWVDHISLVA